MRVVRPGGGRGGKGATRAYVEARLVEATQVIASTPLAPVRSEAVRAETAGAGAAIGEIRAGKEWHGWRRPLISRPTPRGRRSPLLSPEAPVLQAIEAIDWVVWLEDSELMRLVLARAAGATWSALAMRWGIERAEIIKQHRRAIDLIVDRLMDRVPFSDQPLRRGRFPKPKPSKRA